MDAPEVDGKVYLSDDFDAKLGDKIWVQIIHADEYDVWGVRVEYQLAQIGLTNRCENWLYSIHHTVKMPVRCITALLKQPKNELLVNYLQNCLNRIAKNLRFKNISSAENQQS